MSVILAMLQRLHHLLAHTRAHIFGLWFDVMHNVSTTTHWPEPFPKNVDPGRGLGYLPTKPGTVRAILQDLPITHYSDYTFVDFGSGKGRILLLAAEYPFRSVEGIEFDCNLHTLALNNRTTYKNKKKLRAPITCLNIDALDYHFPADNLVLYFFNPFGPEILGGVLSNLAQSLDQHPRDIIVIMVFPEFVGYRALAEKEPWLRACRKGKRYDIYRANQTESLNS